MSAVPGAASGTLLLADRYRLQQLLAVGGMGEVWRADDETLGRSVAVKVLKSEHADDPDFRRRFRTEARLAAGLSHPGIASVFDYGEVQSGSGAPMAYLVMELVEGEALSATLAREGALSPERTLDILGQAGLALDAAHRSGVVHRDVKPGNLIVTPDGTVKVTDFGIARGIGTSTMTEVGTVLGTAYYLSPEQSAGHPATPASDVFALGVVGYECLAGRRPFTGDNPVVVALAAQRDPAPPLPDSVPAPVSSLVTEALAKDPASRPPSAAAFAHTAFAVRAALYDAAPPAPSAAAAPGADTRLFTAPLPLDAAARPVNPGRAGRLRRLGRRRPLRAPAVGLLLLLALLLAALLRTGGPASVTVPQLTGVSLSAAQSRLRADHLRAVTRAVYSSTVPAGSIVGSTPAAGRHLAAGSAVTVLVSRGRAPVTVDAAALIGQPAAQVRSALTAQGLTVRETTVPTTSAAAGTVVSVTPTGVLSAGSTVTLGVATSPPPVPPPAGHTDGKGKRGGD